MQSKNPAPVGAFLAGKLLSRTVLGHLFRRVGGSVLVSAVKGAGDCTTRLAD
ncbi:hypothetical protein [Streptomyces sp. NPDC000410]|uniref:hypothetical protein n=1 Tax=Streptomyces sp. NPDC000410 TaxID=3154254 RepID=UPI00331C358E